MNKRVFRFADRKHGALDSNASHAFAALHALVDHRSGSVCTYIPKNACSSLRLSLAISNGLVHGPENHAWIHANNATMRASLGDMVRAAYTFVIVRDPFERLASAFLDKIVGRTNNAWNLVNAMDYAIDVGDLTFERFVAAVAKPRLRDSNVHWRPQAHFLVYDDYDDYFDFARMPEVAQTLQARCGLALADARVLTRHGRDQVGRSVAMERAWEIPPVELLYRKTKESLLPTVESLYSDELREMVGRAYAEDVDLYRTVRVRGSARP